MIGPSEDDSRRKSSGIPAYNTLLYGAVNLFVGSIYTCKES